MVRIYRDVLLIRDQAISTFQRSKIHVQINPNRMDICVVKKKQKHAIWMKMKMEMLAGFGTLVKPDSIGQH